MPGLSAMVADIPCAPQQSIFSPQQSIRPAQPLIDPPAAAVPVPEVALPNLVQLLLQEALIMKVTVGVLNRLSNRPGMAPFSEACVDVLRSQLGIQQLSDLCTLDTSTFATLPDVAPQEKASLAELCESLKHELIMSGLSLHSLAPATPISSAMIPKSEGTSLHSGAPATTQSSTTIPEVKDIEKSTAQKNCTSSSSEESKWPEHEAKHIAGECQPCAYFAFRADGCRQGDDCEFCQWWIIGVAGAVVLVIIVIGIIICCCCCGCCDSGKSEAVQPMNPQGAWSQPPQPQAVGQGQPPVYQTQQPYQGQQPY